ncbi:MAG: NlpC/P60 family protein [Syntrophales bacterium]
MFQKSGYRFFISALCIFYLTACGGKVAIRSNYRVQPKAPPKTAKKYILRKELEHIGYTIQAGAFAKVDNAAHLTEQLCRKGLNATYFKDPSGLYKVRFGNFETRELARSRAESLASAGVIDVYYIVYPQDQAAAKAAQYGTDYLRNELVKTAESFIDVPYLWGGTTPEKGFDCSGLAKAVYQLNGLTLPRTSREQFEWGTEVDLDDLQKGDLVFFTTKGVDKVSHVGIYAGDGWFIHAPGSGKRIRADSFDSNYFRERFIGARTYI